MAGEKAVVQVRAVEAREAPLKPGDLFFTVVRQEPKETVHLVERREVPLD